MPLVGKHSATTDGLCVNLSHLTYQLLSVISCKLKSDFVELAYVLSNRCRPLLTVFSKAFKTMNVCKNTYCTAFMMYESSLQKFATHTYSPRHRLFYRFHKEILSIPSSGSLLTVNVTTYSIFHTDDKTLGFCRSDGFKKYIFSFCSVLSIFLLKEYPIGSGEGDKKKCSCETYVNPSKDNS